MANQKKSPKPTKNFGAKLRKIIKDNSKSITLAISMTLMSAIMLISKIKTTGHGFLSKQSILIFLVFIIITILIITILYKAKTKSWKIEKTFLFCSLLLGFLYILYMPAGAAPDEPAHFWRAYEISQGSLFTETNNDGDSGIYIPDNLKETTSTKYMVAEHGYLLLSENFSEKASSGYEFQTGGASGYTPFNYIPQVLGIWAGKILSLPLLPMAYLSRIFNLVFCITILFFCIKYSPILKKTIFLIALFPMSMQLFASNSADGSIICSGIALISFVLYCRKNLQYTINIKSILILFMLCAILSLSKPVYAPLCLILFWIPEKEFRSRKQKIFIILLLGILIFGMLLIRMALAPLGGARYDASTQTNFILTNPILYSMLLFKNIILLPEQYITSIIGKNLEWFSIELYAPYIITFFLFFAFLCAEHETRISKSFRIFSFLSFFTIVIATFTAMFIQWSMPGSTDIEGVQGRYFLPILLLIPIFCLPSKKTRSIQLVKTNYLYIFTTLANVYAISIIFCAHL